VTDTTPVVDVSRSPSPAPAAKPTATTGSPCSTESGSASSSALKPVESGTRSTARSSHGAAPTMLASRCPSPTATE
jgi:hypothetical protein